MKLIDNQQCSETFVKGLIVFKIAIAIVGDRLIISCGH